MRRGLFCPFTCRPQNKIPGLPTANQIEALSLTTSLAVSFDSDTLQALPTLLSLAYLIPIYFFLLQFTFIILYGFSYAFFMSLEALPPEIHP